jgi:hypothetical protein
MLNPTPESDSVVLPVLMGSLLKRKNLGDMN